jgi:acyl-CoA thioesterase-1
MSIDRARNLRLKKVWIPCVLLLVAGGLAAAPAAPPAETGRKSAGRPRIVVLADSLATSAGRSSYPVVLQRYVDRGGYEFEVVNAGRGGDTTSGGLRRLEKALSGEVRVLVLELGGNDGLRGVPVEEIKRNLTEIVERAKARGVRVLLAQMETPPSRGFGYTAAFHELFGEVADEQGVELIPFVLANVYGRSEYTTDGVHPNAAGAELIAETVWRSLEPVLSQVASRAAPHGAAGASAAARTE